MEMRASTAVAPGSRVTYQNAGSTRLESSSGPSSDRESPGNGIPLEGKQFVFVGGMHRSGTSFIARALARHPHVSGLTNTGVFEDEGQHLQSVYPADSAFGGPGQFALNAEAHLTEGSRLISDGAREQLLREWGIHWDTSKPILVEKSPANLIQTRFLHALFPDAYFLVVMRHPVASALATLKWVEWQTWARHPWRLVRLLENWLTGHELFLRDSAHLPPGRVLLVRYEDFVTAPAASLARIWRVLGVDHETAEIELPDVVTGVNDRYFARWVDTWWNPVGNLYHSRLVRRFERRAAVFGYSLGDPMTGRVPTPGICRLLRSEGEH